MDLLEGLKSRRTIGVVSEKEVPEQMIEEILDAARWAPNHFRTEPWRFFVLTGDGRKPLGEALARIAAKDMDEPEREENKEKLEKTKQKSLRAPVIIAVAVEPGNHPRVILKEEYAAVNAAIQNMLLAAHALGLGAIWRTGKPCYDKEISKLFNLSEQGEVLGFIYIGYPNMNPPVAKRKEIAEVTKWIRNESDFVNGDM